MMWRGIAVILAVFAAMASLPFVREDLGLTLFYLVLLSSILFWTAQATSWNILSGYSGYFSFGQGALVGLGAYTAAVLSARHGWSFFATIPVAAGLSAVLALAIGGIAFRLRSFRGEIFALLTLAVPFILAAFARLNTSIDGGQGIIVPVPTYPEGIGNFQEFLYLLNLGVAAAAVVAAFAIQRSRLGWGLAAIRDAEDVAEGIGVGTFRHKMAAIVISAIIGGVSGSIFALQIGFVAVESVFGLTIPLFVIVMSVLGGRMHWLGPAIGAGLIVILQDRLAASGLEGWRLIILGGILALLVVAAPEGLQARLRARPVPTLAAFVVAGGGFALIGGADEPLDWISVGMVAAAAVALWPSRRRTGVSPRMRPAPAGEPADTEGASAEPSLARASPPGEPERTDTAASGSTVALNGERPALVQCAGVFRYFGGVRALEDLSLEIRAGELIGLVGPNGSGKTTLVNLLAGAFRPTAGQIRVAGRDIAGMPPHRIAHVGVARTYQIPRPFPSMTVRDNVAMAIMFGRQPRRLADARQAAAEHLEFVKLSHLADAYPGEINLHERQLLEMARAIASSPKVLLLDEALAGLNPAEIDNAVEVVRRIHASGITIVIVEHLLRVVNQLATRIVVLDRGRLLADGEPQTVMRDPAVVTAYLGKHAHA